MTISELKILIDLNKDHVEDILYKYCRKYCKRCRYGYFFIDSDNGSCHLFNANGDEDDISNIKCIYENMISKDIKKIVILDFVESIGNYAFSDCTSLTTITIPNSVKSVGNYAFFNCTSLESITILDSVKDIGNGAFSDCISLTSFIIPNSVNDIGYAAFYGCTSLTTITIPNSIKSIGNRVFSMCSSLESISIPDSVEKIGTCTFSYCTSLKEIIFEGKTIEEVRSMKNYHFGIEDKSIIICN